MSRFIYYGRKTIIDLVQLLDWSIESFGLFLKILKIFFAIQTFLRVPNTIFYEYKIMHHNLNGLRVVFEPKKIENYL